MNLYDQLLELQKLPNAYEEWVTYRSQLTDFIIDQLVPQTHVALWGIGESNDIDLQRLATHCSHLTLLDKNETSLKAALKRYNLESHHAITLKVVDFINLESLDYRHFADALIEAYRYYGKEVCLTPMLEIAHHFLEEATNCLNSSLDTYTSKTFHHTIAIGLHSQLASMVEWIWRIVLEKIGLEDESFRNQLSSFNTLCVSSLNKKMIDATQYSIIVGCETKTVGQKGAIEGARQCLSDLYHKSLEGLLDLEDTMDFYWPFYSQQRIAYIMEIQVFSIHKL